ARDLGRALGRVVPVARVRIEAVTEHSAGLVGDERVLAVPSGSVRGVERIDEQKPAVRVERLAGRRRLEAVDGLPLVRRAAEDLVELAAVDPVVVDLELRQVAGPVRV